VEEVGAEVITKHKSTLDSIIVEEVQEWVEDPIYSRTQDTKYFRIAKAY
jgi:hypothetical protein